MGYFMGWGQIINPGTTRTGTAASSSAIGLCGVVRSLMFIACIGPVSQDDDHSRSTWDEKLRDGHGSSWDHGWGKELPYVCGQYAC